MPTSSSQLELKVDPTRPTMSKAPSSYKYKRLDSSQNEIRLFKLLPGSYPAVIEIEIFHAASSSESNYESLSYVWGSPDRKHEVIVGGISGVHQVLRISRNLSVALHHLRLASETRTLWVDAICINQDDLDERSEEVRKMGLIYSNARRVVVWLGEGSRDSALAVGTLRSIGDEVDFDDTHRIITCKPKPGTKTSELSENYHALRAKVLSWIAIRDLLNRAWFTRLWIFQEIGLASDAIVVIGDDKINWQVFRAAVFWITFTTERSTPLSDIFDAGKLRQINHLLFRMVAKPFHELLGLTKYSVCFDLRDRIYAVLSLLPPNDPMRVIPNYAKTPAEVYTDFVLQSISTRGRLDLLYLCTPHNPASVLALPSWVPDFSTPNLCQEIQYLNASGISREESQYNRPENCLRIRGHFVGIINHISTSISVLAKLPEVLAVCHAWEPSCASTKEYVTGELLIDAFVRLLFWNATQNAKFSGKIPKLATGELRKLYDNSVVKGLNSKTPMLYARLLRSVALGRAFFTTEEGYIGVGPASAVPGDRISIVLGSATPIILRSTSKTQNHYEVVGGCLVAGLANGEGLLGPLPFGWTFDWVKLDWGEVMTFMYPGGQSTQLDPRAGDFPPGWKVRYGLEGYESEMGDQGQLRKQWFENVETGEKTQWDPRLTSENLKKLGVDVRDIILV